MTLKSKFSLCLVLLIGTLSFIFSFLVYEQVKSHLMSQAKKNLNRFLEHESQHWTAEKHPKITLSEKNISLTVRRNGVEIYHSPAKEKTEHITASHTRDLSDGVYEFSGDYSLAETNELLQALTQFLIASGLIVMVLTAPLSYLAAWIQLFPFRILATATQQFSAQSLNRRLAVPETKDEYGLLVRSFNNLFARLQNSFDELQRYAQSVSHEFRTPLSVIIAQTESALKKEGSISQKTTLQKVLQQAHKLDQMVSLLLTLGDIRRWASRESKNSIDVVKVSQELAESVMRREWAKGKNFLIKTEELETPTVQNYEELLATVLGNLLENAFFFASSQVVLSLATIDGSLEIIVEDDGPGIPTENMQKVFEPFFTSRVSGHGLGLTIVKAAVESTGGSISLTKSELNGLLARAYLPQEIPEH